MSVSRWGSYVLCLAMLPWPGMASGQSSDPPLAPDEPVRDSIHGVTVVDHYRWMEGAPIVPRLATWLTAQNRHTRDRLDALPGRDAALAQVMRYRQDVDLSVVADAVNGREIVMRYSSEVPWVRYFLRRDGRETLLLDAKGGSASSTFRADWSSLSPNGRWFAYGLSEGGTELSLPRVIDLDTLADSPMDPRVADWAGWTADGNGVFLYRRREGAVVGASDFREGGACWLHVIGADPASDVRVFSAGEGPGFQPQSSDEPYCEGAPGSRWILGIHRLNDTFLNQIYIADGSGLGAGKLQWRRVAGSEDGIQQLVLVGDTVYAIGNGRVANGELRAIDARSGDFSSAEVVLPAAEQVLDSMVVASDGLYVLRGLLGSNQVVRIARDGKVEAVAGMPDGQISHLRADRVLAGFRYVVSDRNSLPAAYQVSSLQGPGLHDAGVSVSAPTDWNLSRFEVLRTRVAARDGAMIPVTLLRQRQATGPRAVLLKAYGAYGYPADQGFRPDLLALVESGIDIATVGVRGGGDLGETWHRDGMKLKKSNTWRDAIDVGEWLLHEGHAAPGKLALWGGSAGGILVGRAYTERPDLWGAAIGDVGAFNTLRFEFTANGPGNVAEFGSVKDPDEFRGLLAMDSVQAVRKGVDYPPILLTTGLNDQLVESWQVAKFAAALLQNARRRANVWLSVEDDAGHSISSADDELRSQVDRLAFLKQALDVP